MLRASRGRSTRSQITLPASVLDGLSLDQSPLKAARTAARINSSQNAARSALGAAETRANMSTHDSQLTDHNQTTSSSTNTLSDARSDDGLPLPSHLRIPQKRFPPDSLRLGEQNENEQPGREIKRARMESDAESNGLAGRTVGPSKRLDLNSLGKLPFPGRELEKSRSVSTLEGSPSRARSVDDVPHIDLKTMPPSPWRTSTSPGKRYMRIASVPPQASEEVSQLDQPLGVAANIDQNPATTPTRRTLRRSPSSLTLDTQPQLNDAPTSTSSTSSSLPTTTSSPPAHSRPSSPMSPLTPLGVTPAPFKPTERALRAITPTTEDRPPLSAFAFPTSPSSPLTEQPSSSNIDDGPSLPPLVPLNISQPISSPKNSIPRSYAPTAQPSSGSAVTPGPSHIPHPSQTAATPNAKTSAAVADLANSLSTPGLVSSTKLPVPESNATVASIVDGLLVPKMNASAPRVTSTKSGRAQPNSSSKAPTSTRQITRNSCKKDGPSTKKQERGRSVEPRAANAKSLQDSSSTFPRSAFSFAAPTASSKARATTPGPKSRPSSPVKLRASSVAPSLERGENSSGVSAAGSNRPKTPARPPQPEAGTNRPKTPGIRPTLSEAFGRGSTASDKKSDQSTSHIGRPGASNTAPVRQASINTFFPSTKQELGNSRIGQSISTPSNKSTAKPASKTSVPGPLMSRSFSSASTKPASSALTRSVSNDNFREPFVRPASSLDTLSMALEKLDAPAPERRSSAMDSDDGNDRPRARTSLGFNHDPLNSEDDSEPVSRKGKGKARAEPPRSAISGRLGMSSRDDSSIISRSSVPPQSISGIKRPMSMTTPTMSESARKRHQSVGPMSAPKSLSAKSSFATPTNESFKVPAVPHTAHGANSSNGARKPFGTIGGTGVMGSRFAARASKRPMLATVEASPVKPDAIAAALGVEPSRNPNDSGDRNFFQDVTMEDLFSPIEKEGKNRPSAWRNNASRRASLASQLLTQSLAEIPQTPPEREMPPPPPPEYTTGSGSRNTSRRAAANAAIANSDPSHVSKRSERAKSEAPESKSRKKVQPAVTVLDVLKECTIFVDVRTDEGDDAGSLFREMLQGLGAKLVTRVGNSCTHIVFKNGLMSTVTRWRLMNEPRAFVVGIGWVVECVERRAKVDEQKFQVDLEGTNIAGVNKRRRSMLPKHMFEDGPSTSSPNLPPSDLDSDDGALTAMSVDENLATPNSNWDSLPPLERARLRKAAAAANAR